MSELGYSPAEICEIFDISKSTLFRWEEEELIPVVRRDRHHQRQYERAHLKAISDRQKQVLKKRFDSAAELDDERSLVDLEHIHESNALRKMLVGDRSGFDELESAKRIAASTIKHLLRIASSDNVARDSRAAIARILWMQLSKPES